MEKKILDLIEELKETQQIYYDVKNPRPENMMLYSTYSEFIEALEDIVGQ